MKAREDSRMLRVVPCSQSLEENKKFRLYYCPAPRSHRNSEFLGIYANRSVRFIGCIRRVLGCKVDLRSKRVACVDTVEVITPEEQERILGATAAAQRHGWDLSRGHKFYLCDSLEETDFRKDTPGGIMGHRYFDLGRILDGTVPNDTSKIAELLRGRTWPKLGPAN